MLQFKAVHDDLYTLLQFVCGVTMQFTQTTITTLDIMYIAV